MRRGSLLMLALLLPAFVLACTSERERAPTLRGQGAATIRVMPTNADLGRLVPPEAAFVVCAPSLDELAEKIGNIEHRVAPEETGQLNSTSLLEKMLSTMPFPGITADMVDTAKPLALAGVFKPGVDEPAPIFILPMKDVKAAAAAVTKATGGQLRPPVSGTFLGLGTPGVVTPLPEKPPAVAADLAAGDLSIRVDLASLLRRFGPELRGVFDQAFDQGLKESAVAGGPDLSGFGSAIKNALGVFLDSAEGLDLALSLEGETLSLRILFRAKEGSALGAAPAPSANLARFAAGLPGDFPMAMALTFDAGKMMEWMKPFLDSFTASLPEGDQGAFRAYMDRSMELMKLLGRELVGGMEFGPKGMRMVEILSAKDAKGYVEKTIAFVEEMGDTMKDAGMEFTPEGRRELVGFDVTTIRMKMDPARFYAAAGPGGEKAAEASKAMLKRLFGPEGLAVHMAAVGDRVVAVVGDDRLLVRALKAATGEGSPNSLVRAMAAAGGRPKFLLRMDLRGFLGEIFDMMRDIMPEGERADLPDLGEGAPIPLTVDYTSEGRSYSMGMSVNVVEILHLFAPSGEKR